METSNSLGARTFLPGPVQKSSTGTVRVPPGPAIRQTAEWAIKAGMESAAGEELQRLPPKEARFWICMPPISVAASFSPG